jgi:NAD(P)-dependent dehydrogenase (short-subunit alcohol dehydrogenase family)
MLLNGKSAVIYGGVGALGGAIARVFGREGAKFSVRDDHSQSLMPLRETSPPRVESSRRRKSTCLTNGPSRSTPRQSPRLRVESKSRCADNELAMSVDRRSNTAEPRGIG